MLLYLYLEAPLETLALRPQQRPEPHTIAPPSCARQSVSVKVLLIALNDSARWFYRREGKMGSRDIKDTYRFAMLSGDCHDQNKLRIPKELATKSGTNGKLGG
jgi:hypothetical protein